MSSLSKKQREAIEFNECLYEITKILKDGFCKHSEYFTDSLTNKITETGNYKLGLIIKSIVTEL